MSKTIPVMELFGPTIQGEGILTGTVSHFLRTGGCPLRCKWCDSMFAVLPEEVKKHGKRMTTAEILDGIYKLPYAPYITFTGGDPCMYELLGDLIPSLNANQIRVAVETQGTLFPDWLWKADILTFSPKGPSSGNIVDVSDLIQWLSGHHVVPRRQFKVCIKIVIFNEDDMKYALEVHDKIDYSQYDAFYFTAGTPPFNPNMIHPSTRRLDIIRSMERVSDMLLEEGQLHYNDKTHIGAQMHALLWPTVDKGV